ncbi:MAG: hypothetical protein V7L25_13870 [Nostoc sp.]|uniref:hypothetical protein n=1 Tax=Nostoc sp. TaxID=1180 RepID=UPI002FF063E9
MKEQIKDKEKKIKELQAQGETQKSEWKSLQVEKEEFQHRIPQLEDSLQTLKDITNQAEIYSKVKEWLVNNIEEGLAEYAGTKALGMYHNVSNSDQVTEFIGQNKIVEFCKSLNNYLKWVEASLKAGAPIRVDKKRLEPVLSIEVYKMAFDHIKSKLSSDISNEAAEQLMLFLNRLVQELSD